MSNLVNTVLSISLQLCRQYLTLTLLSGESLGMRLDNTYMVQTIGGPMYIQLSKS